MKQDSRRKTINTVDRLVSLIIILAGFAVVVSNISNGSDRFSLDRLGVWYDVILITATISCVCCNIRSERHSFASWAGENWYIVLYLILRFVSGAANGVIGNEWFILIVCSEAFLLLAVNTSTARPVNIRVILCMITTFDLIVVSICIYHYFFLGDQMQSILNTLAQGRITMMPFSLVFYNPNSAGLIAGLTTSILVTVLVKGYQRRTKLLFIPLIIINVIFVWWSQCRTAMAGVGAVCAVLILNRFIKGFDYKELLSAAIICCIAAMIPAYVGTLTSGAQAGMSYSVTELRINEISSGRYNIWKQHIASQEGHYLLGFATNTNAINVRVKRVEELQLAGMLPDDERMSAAKDPDLGIHNGYLELMLLTGIPGFLLIMFYLFKRMRRMDKSTIDEHPEILILIYLFSLCTQESRFITSGLNSITLLMFLMLNYGSAQDVSVAETGREEYALCEGLKESTVYLTESSGRNVRTHILKIAKNSGTRVKAVWGGYDKDHPQDSGFSSLSREVKEYAGPGKIIAASNADYYDLNGNPYGMLVMEGNVIRSSSSEPFFAVMNDGSYEIKEAGESAENVSEAVGGSVILLKNGSIRVENDAVRHPRQAIGICRDGSLVILNAEGRQPDSSGLSLYDLARMMKNEGCVDALNLDGGGSAGLMTRRSDDDVPVFRNTQGDGFERNISSALLVINDDDSLKTGKDPDKKNAQARKSRSSTFFRISERGRYDYQINGEKVSGLYTINGESFLFDRGKGVTGTISLGETEYTFTNGKYDCSSDAGAGEVLFGYCGSEEYDGRNLIYALQKGNGVLNIGLNPSAVITAGRNDGADLGEMEDWFTTQEQMLPWYAYRHRIRSVYLADGVTTIGSRFLYLPKGLVKGGTKPPLSELGTLRLPKSLKKIGKYAFYNKPLLKKVTIPSTRVKIGRKAFDAETKVQMEP